MGPRGKAVALTAAVMSLLVLGRLGVSASRPPLASAASGPSGSSSATPTSTLPATAEPTKTATPSPTPLPPEADDQEPNDDPRRATPVGVGTVLRGLTLHDGDEDWFMVRLVGQRDYVFEARLTGGGDPRMRLFDAAGTTLLADAGDGGVGVPSPSIRYRAETTRVALLAVTSEMAHLLCRYELLVMELMPTATAPPVTLPPTPTPSDGYEPNGSFDTATALAVGYRLRAAIGPSDNDFYRLHVEAGVRYRCEAAPQGNLDTNLIVYDRGRAGIGGNNNAAPDSPGSAFSWGATYNGWVYLLVGPVAGTGPYDLLCTVPEPRREAYPGAPTASDLTVEDERGPTPAPTRTAAVIPTATRSAWSGGESVTPSPAAPSAWEPPVRVVAYYDENDNGAPDPAEGIVGGLVLLLDVSTNRPVDRAATDQFGAASLRVPPVDEGIGSFRVSVPFLGFSRRTAPGDRIEIEIEAQKLPGLIP